MSTAASPTHPSRAPRLGLQLHDAGSSGIIDIADLRAEPLPLSLAPPGPPDTPSTPAPEPRASRPVLGLATAVASSLMMVLGAVGIQRAHGPDAIEDAPIERQLSMQEVAAPTQHAVIDHDEPEPLAVAVKSPDETLDAKAETTEDAPAKRSKGVESNRKSKSSKGTNKGKSSKSSKSSKTPAKTKTGSKASVPKDRSIPVECVLNPASCTKTGQPRTTPGHAAPKPTDKPSSKLSNAQLKKALASTKADARRCGPEHGVDSGTRVAVKLSIEGRTGKVISALAQGDHARSSLGRCVAGALSRTEFPEFSSPRMGMVYTVRM